MVTRKYIKDYRLDYELDRRGRMRTNAVYIGGDYGFAEPESASPRRKTCTLVLTVAGWIAFIVALLPRSLASDTIYCVVPFAFSALSLGFESAGTIALLTVKDPFRHEQADKIAKRLPTSALTTMILSCVSLLGLLVSAIVSRGALQQGDAVFTIFCALLAVSSLIQFRITRRMKTVKREG